ncbi:hypothetical protein MOUN0_M06018 [Monosporozyma unispora]|nr:j-protein (type III) [Kazachstania unispora]
MELDQTTLYSILGLSSNASTTEISKSYKNLARRLHPDKSKSTNSEELFKIIVEAHSILTDEQEKLKYDRELMLNGLYGYHPIGKHHSNVGKSNDTFGVPTYPRKGQPYGSQPYGFGFKSSAHKDSTKEKSRNEEKHATKKSSKSAQFKSFNVKSYQRAQRNRSDDPLNNNNNNNDKNNNNNNDKNNSESNTPDNFVNTNTTPDEDINVPMDTDVPIEEEISNNEGQPVDEELSSNKSKEESVESNPFINKDQTQTSDEQKKEPAFNEDDKEESRAKIRKSTKDTIDSEQTVPSWDYIQRQHLRARQRTKESSRRSNSPIKMSPTTNDIGVEDNWKTNLRDIIDRMNNIDQNKSNLTTIKRPEDIAFDLENINESLDSIPVPSSKRSKTDQDDGFLHKPVNTTLPRVYKKEILHEEESFIIPEILKRPLPNQPNFHVNISNPVELENCKNDVIRFNNECNDLKRQILSTYMNRLMFDMNNNEKITRIENTILFLKCRRFDTELTNKLQELEYKQSMVSHTFSNMVSGMYPTDTI